MSSDPSPAPDPVPAAIVDELIARLERRELTLGVIGLGYVGLPLALAFADRGFGVLGFDVDMRKVEALEAGRSYIPHVDGERVARHRQSERLRATGDFARLGEPDALLICVPTPLDSHRDPDLGYVETTARQIAARLRPGQLVVLESTTYPGTTQELLLPILAAGGLECGKDFFLAFSPEREDPGNPKFSTTNVPKVVGGIDAVSGDLAEALYRQIVPKVVRVSTAATAEATKLMENVFRAVNIALVNELKIVYDAMGIDVWEVLDAAATKPFGFMRFTPGPGWGGHCIPVDPFYLSWKAREHGLRARFIELAGEVNCEMPRHVVGKLQEALNHAGKPVRGSAVLLLGLAYKPDVGDPRESPAFEILARLLELGARVSYHDPHVARAPVMRTWPALPRLESQPLTPELLAAQDVVMVVTDHAAVDYELVAEHAPLIVDTRGVYRWRSEKIIPA